MRLPLLAPWRDPAAAMPSGATVLGVWAHPDDEAFVAAGALAGAAGRGCRVVSVYATMGERGWQGPPERRAADLGGIRSGELTAALAALGIDAWRCLDYPDGGLAEIPFAVGVARVLAVLQEIQPAVVLTFGPDGFTGHPDHMAVSAWVTAAVHLWDGVALLRHTAVTREWAGRFAPELEAFNAFWPGHPVATPASDLAWSWRLDDGLLERKVAALRAHRSQTTHLFDALGEPFIRAMAATEWFRIPAVAAHGHLQHGRAAAAWSRRRGGAPLVQVPGGAEVRAT